MLKRCLLIPTLCTCSAFTQTPAPPKNLDAQVQAFLKRHAHRWQDLNVPEVDGRLLYNIILDKKYTRALEIGTSTGYSSIWIAWALSKTGGKLITIEIDKERHEQAVAHFKEAGLLPYIDARLADAHALVPRLEGPFDFVFSDADKEWYQNYFNAVAPKLVVGGCFTTHNVTERGWGWGPRGYAKFLKSLPAFETTFNDEGGGLAISYKRAAK